MIDCVLMDDTEARMGEEVILTPELRHLNNLMMFSSPILRSRTLASVSLTPEEQLPVQALELGSESDDVPVLLFVGGVHGVERIGSQVVLAFLETLIQRLQWDHSLTGGLKHLRLVFVPILNPVGLIRQTRANGAGIDLLRNAPVDAPGKAAFLVGGHRLGGWLPWYRGKSGAIEPEAKALFDLVMAETARSPCVLALDVHSGFGMYDRLWFPYARSREPVPRLAEFYALYQLMQRTYPHLDYVFEPQSRHYITHGDLWDWMALEAEASNRLLLPLTLEMGSWRWVKKNPLQLRSLQGLFNPTKPHRLQRVLRRHVVLMEFLIRAARASDAWLPCEHERLFKQRDAVRRWYEQYG
ncbi:M14 family zinc carboxypeptidase [Litorivivens sp.]|uniref:M14 family zinc carboxypeptidase n=1 Tax=Litorivivens sp. TaxID=2020868 RepID=UPI00356997B3